MTNLELKNALNALKAEISELKAARQGPFPFEHIGMELELLRKEIKNLGNKYVMLNARVSRKNGTKEKDG